MKKILLPVFFLSLFAGLFTGLFAQQGWEWRNPMPQGNPLNSISFLRDYGMAVGEGGTILHTMDGGSTWRLVDLGIRDNLNSVVMHDDLMAFVSGDGGALYFIMYHDSRDEFEVKRLPSNTEADLHAVTSHINDCPWVAGDAGTILLSEDFGESWESQNDLYNFNLSCLDNIECTSAWATGPEGAVLYTSDWGISWESRQVPTSWDLYSVDVGQFDNIRVCGQVGNIWHTSDKGLTWTKEHEQSGYNLYDIENVGLNAAYAVGGDGTVLETADYGDTWTPLEAETTTELYDVYYHGIGYDHMWAVGYYGTMLKNSGIGNPFELQNTGTMEWLYSVDFVNDTVGIAVGGNSGWGGEEKGIILKTTDGGKTWEHTHNFSKRIYEIDMVSETRGYIVGDDGTFRFTGNGGGNWISKDVPVSSDLYGVSFSDEDNGWAVSRYAEIIHTEDGGLNWEKQTSPSPNPLHDVFAVNDSTAYAVGLDSTVIRTNDRGATWEELVTKVSRGYRFGSVHFFSEDFGCVAGIYGGIIITEDGGESWREVDSRTDVILNDIWFSDRQNGWIAGDRGTVLRTVDGGNTWFAQRTGVTSNFLAAVHFTGLAHGCVVGEAGTILTTENGGFCQTRGMWKHHSLGLQIVDLATVTDTIYPEIDEGNLLAGLEVYIDSLLHSAPDELQIRLTHEGVTVELIADLPAGDGDLLWLTLADGSDRLLSEGIAPFCGEYLPLESLAAFDGLDPAGPWILEVQDLAGGNTGTLQAWGIRPEFIREEPAENNIIDEGHAPNKLIRAYPNPASELVYVDCSPFSGEPKVEMIVVDCLGKEVLRKAIVPELSGTVEASFSTVDFSEGLYYLIVKSAHSQQSLKFLVLH